jgi:hypothetical protein
MRFFSEKVGTGPPTFAVVVARGDGGVLGD